MSNITVLELQNLISKDAKTTLLDVRTPAEFESAHIDGSINIPLNQLDPAGFLKNNNHPNERKIYLLCQRGARAQHAAKLFENKSLGNAVVVDGGVSAWIEAGYKVIEGKTRVISLERQVRIAAGSLVLLGVLFSIFVHPAFIWLSAVVGAGLINAGITDWCGMGLLLARLPWNQNSKKCC